MPKSEGVPTEEDAFVLGSDWDQWSTGRDKWIDGYRAQIGEIPGLRFEAGERLCAYEEGTVGWAADQPNIVLPDGTAVPVRATAVFRQEGGGWKIVTLHVSFGVPDAKLEELLPQLLS
jgi:hypothetical protein